MPKEFFSLENILLGGLFLTLLIYSGFMMSCIAPDSGVFSVDRSDEDAAVANSRADRNLRHCEERDSCQDSCDYMFRNSSARSRCYDLSFGDVSDLEYVYDELHSSSISKRSLEDIDVDDFEDFLDVDVDGWVDIIVGEEGSDHDGHPAYTSAEAKSALGWIADNADVARAISHADEDHDILYHLFLQLNTEGTQSDATATRVTSPTDFPGITRNGSTSAQIRWFDDGVDFNTSPLTKLTLGGTPIVKFVLSFIGASSELQFGGSSFISYAEDEDNEEAIDLAYESLVIFCEDATDHEFPEDEDVQQCMMAVYCSIYNRENSDNIFDNVLGNQNADPEDCAAGRITDGDVLEDLFR